MPPLPSVSISLNTGALVACRSLPPAARRSAIRSGKLLGVDAAVLVLVHVEFRKGRTAVLAAAARTTVLMRQARTAGGDEQYDRDSGDCGNTCMRC